MEAQAYYFWAYGRDTILEAGHSPTFAGIFRLQPRERGTADDNT